MKKILSVILAVSFVVFGFSQTKHYSLKRSLLLSTANSRTKVITNRPVQSKSNQAKGIFLMADFNNGLPSGWTVTDGGNDGYTWEVVQNYDGKTLDGTPFAFVNSDAAGYTDMDEILESPAIDVSSADSVFLALDQYYNSYSGNEEGDIDVWDGNQWVTVFKDTVDTGAWGNPMHLELNVTAYKNANFKVRFHYYNANWDWYWAIDNVTIYQPDSIDLIAKQVSAKPFNEIVDLPRPITFSTKVLNFGMSPITKYVAVLQVLLNNDTVFSVQDTVITNLNHNDIENHVFSQTWTPEQAGTYIVRSYVITDSDAVAENDTVYSQINVIGPQNYHDFIYGFVTYDQDSTGDINHIVGIDPSTGDYVAILDSLSLTDIFIAGDYVNINGHNYLLGVTFDNNLYVVEDHGQAYNLGTLPNIDTNAVWVPPLAITWDSKNNNVYLVYLDMVSFSSFTQKLFKLDLNTLQLTEVGNVAATGIIVGVAVDTNGTLYSLDLADTLATIDTSNANFNVIGDIGIDIAYIQDIAIDRATNTLYGTLYNNTTKRGELYVINTDASLQFIDSIKDEITLSAIWSNMYVSSADKINKPNISIYPNPASRVIHVTNAQGYNLQILDLTGRVILSQPIISNMQLVTLPNVQSGLYLVNLKGKQGQFTYKLIVR